MFENHFGWLDWVVVGGTLLVSLLIGIYYAIRSKNSNEDLLVGGRKMRILPVAASVMVTYVSAITVLGFPAEVYSFGGQIFMIHAVSAIAFPLSAFLFIPFFYRMKLTSINEYLEQRFDSKWVRWLASATFILQQTTLSGVILYAPSIALEAFLGFPVWLSILGIGICGTIYTSIGGLKAVVVTDAFQFLMMVAGMVAIVWKGVTSSGGISNAFQVASEYGRLNFIDLTFDPFMRHNLWNFLIGSGFYALMQPAVHQLQVQRYSSMPSISHARKAIIYSVPLKLTVMLMCLLTGISIFAMYAHCDPFKQGEIKKVDQIVPYFVVKELANIPGMIGLFTACIFSAVLSSISSALNSLSAVTWEDFLSRNKYFKEMRPSTQANVSRLIGLFYGILTMGLAFGAQNLGAIYSATFAAVGATGGALFGVFLLGMFCPFANFVGAIAGMLTGLGTMIVISVTAFIHKVDLIPLPTFVDQCPIVDALTGGDNSTDLDFATTTFEPTTMLMDMMADDDKYELHKIFKLSYLLYSVVAAGLTIGVGIIVSVLALICVKSTRKFPRKKYLHPIVQKMCGVCSHSPKEGVLTTSSIIHMDPVQFKMQASAVYNGSKNGHSNPQQKRKHSSDQRKSVSNNNLKNGATNKGYDASSEL